MIVAPRRPVRDMLMSSVRIYVCCHKPFAVLPAKHFVPIHVGRELASADVRRAMSGYRGDDTGDHISGKNGRYAELTAHYWVWKNTPPEKRTGFVGFFHYRRYLAMRSSPVDSYPHCLPETAAAQKYGWTSEALIKECANLDFVGHPWWIHKDSVYDLDKTYRMMTPERWKLHAKLPAHPTLYDHYRLVHRQQDLDAAIEIVKRRHPGFDEALATGLQSERGYFLNMFIMRWELFDEYCAWLFPILDELDARMLANEQDAPEGFQCRAIGFLGERLLNVFLASKRRHGAASTREGSRGIAFISQPSPKPFTPPRLHWLTRLIKKSPLVERAARRLRHLFH